MHTDTHTLTHTYTKGCAIVHTIQVGEPIMYPEINALVDELHARRISSFLVTNAQFPDAIRNVSA